MTEENRHSNVDAERRLARDCFTAADALRDAGLYRDALIHPTVQR